MKLIFGSVAVNHWFEGFRKSKDLDYISKDTSKNSREIEYHWNEGFQYILDNNIDETYVDPNFLYTIKFSHAPWDVRWGKTMKDLKFLKDRGCELDRELCDILRKDWEVIHGKKRVNLNMETEEFFNKHVTRRFNHDELHEKLAFYKVPMHTKIRRGDSPMCYEDLWDDLSHEDRIKCCLEEIYVIATERYLRNCPEKQAKFKAMKNLITTMTKGWFNDFLIDNFEELLYNQYDREWFQKMEKLK
jgi:hypothetical protein